ncbi:MAG: hypothetical protein RDU13_01895 [Elusimicrobiales bacterium]|jgi:hypothetical protein|nr:hypothetical protein [Elusimicrobiales bacterium]
METVHKITIELSLTRRKVLVMLTLFFLCWRPGSLGSETLTMTTYYPAPYGGYARLLTTNQTLLARDGGNVGIGMAAPTSRLHVGGEIRTNDQIRWGNGRGTLTSDQGASIELGGTGTPYIDFSQNTVQDFSARLWLSQAGRLEVVGDLSVTGSIRNVCTIVPVTNPGGCGSGRPVAQYPANTGAVVRYALNRSGSDLHNSGNWSMFNANPGGWGGNMLCCRVN